MNFYIKGLFNVHKKDKTTNREMIIKELPLVLIANRRAIIKKIAVKIIENNKTLREEGGPDLEVLIKMITSAISVRN